MILGTLDSDMVVLLASLLPSLVVQILEFDYHYYKTIN